MELKDNSEIYKHLLKKVVSKEFKVGIIGLGYVGLPLALGFCEKGITTFGFDININIINSLRRCESYMEHISSNELEKYIQNKKLNPDTTYEEIEAAISEALEDVSSQND